MTKNVFANSDQVVTGGTPDNVVVPYAGDTGSGQLSFSAVATGSLISDTTVSRVTQAAQEVAVNPTSTHADVSQLGLETVLEPSTSLDALVSQAAIEIALKIPPPNAGVTQIAIETALEPSTSLNAAVTQAGVEGVISTAPAATNARTTQIGVEVAGQRPVLSAGVTQAAVETALLPTDAHAWATQVGIEIAIHISHITARPRFTAAVL